MSSTFQGLVDADGKVVTSLLSSLALPRGAISFRGIALSVTGQVLTFTDDGLVPRTFNSGFAVHDNTGVVLLSPSGTSSNTAPGGVRVDGNGALVVDKVKAPDVIHQGVGLINDGSVTVVEEAIGEYVQRYAIENLFSNLPNNRDPGQRGGSWDNWTPVLISGGTVNLSGENNSIAECSAPAGGRGLLQASFDYVTGQYYAVTVDVLSISGATSNSFMQVNAAESFGSDRVNADSIGRWGILFQVGTGSSGWVRIGVGTNGGVSAQETVVVTNPQIQAIASDQLFSDWVRTKTTSSYAPGNTFTGTDGLVNQAQGAFIPGPKDPWTDVAAIGDSFANEADEWPTQLDSVIPGIVRGDGFAGDKLSTVVSQYFADLLGVDNYTGVVLQGGVNDIASDCTLESLQIAIKSATETVRNVGAEFVLVNVAPFKNNAAWNASRQTLTEQYNAWLASWCADNKIPLADIYTALGDPGDSEALNAAYDSGDGLHTNAAGSLEIANTIKAAMGYT